MNHGYHARSVIRVEQLLTIATDDFQKDDVSDCHGIPLDRLPNPRLYLWYNNLLLCEMVGSELTSSLRRHSTADIPVHESHSICTTGCELNLLVSDLGGTDRWTWFVSSATIQT